MNSPSSLPDHKASHPTVLSQLTRALRYSGAKLLVAIGLLIFATPFIYDLPDGGLVESVLLTLVMVFAVLQVGERRRSLITAIVLVTPAQTNFDHYLMDRLHCHHHPD